MRWGGLERKGIAIGNLTSQIFANIYLNELDRFVRNTIKPQAYLRYGDDFIIFSKDLAKLEQIRENVIGFLDEKLRLAINFKNNIIIRPKWGLKFLGVIIDPNLRVLNKRNQKRIIKKLNLENLASYFGLVKQYDRRKLIEFNWQIMEKLYE